jgi:hypothetical protein
MATTAIYAKVAENIKDGYPRLRVWETYDFKGEPRNRLWTIWLDIPNSMQKDDEIKVTGDLGTKVGTYNKPGQETKQVVEHSLNNVTIELMRAAELKLEPIQEVINIMAPGEPKDLPF